MRVLVLGSFDVLHYGHIRFLNLAVKLGDVYVGLGTDEYQIGYKRAPVCTYEERLAALSELPMVKGVFPRTEKSIVSICRMVCPDYLVAGSDWIDAPYLELSGVDVTWLEEHNIGLVYLPRDHDMSTTRILERVRGT